MWTMVDGQADHTLTHNRPKRSSPYSVCAPRAIRFFFAFERQNSEGKESASQRGQP
uniref:Uncharacterized protein n=1 Tax=Vibrio sp. VP2(2010) TaxID=749331 RepID=D5JEI1_9VIBR|nr:hypothetical protein repV2-ORF1 [Vibrio sp. VP2(2010)]